MHFDPTLGIGLGVPELAALSASKTALLLGLSLGVYALAAHFAFMRFINRH